MPTVPKAVCMVRAWETPCPVPARDGRGSSALSARDSPWRPLPPDRGVVGGALAVGRVWGSREVVCGLGWAEGGVADMGGLDTCPASV